MLLERFEVYHCSVLGVFPISKVEFTIESLLGQSWRILKKFWSLLRNRERILHFEILRTSITRAGWRHIAQNGSLGEVEWQT